MVWSIKVTYMFESWWNQLTEAERISVDAYVQLLEAQGPHLPFPYSCALKQNLTIPLRELRIQHKCKPYRILYAFDKNRTAVLLLGGIKSKNKHWYKQNIGKAKMLFQQHHHGIVQNL